MTISANQNEAQFESQSETSPIWEPIWMKPNSLANQNEAEFESQSETSIWCIHDGDVFNSIKNDKTSQWFENADFWIFVTDFLFC